MKKWLTLFLVWGATVICNATPLPAAKVFELSASRIDPNTFLIHWQIKPGYFLYSDRIKLTEEADSNSHLGVIRFPETVIKKDSHNQVYSVYRDELSLAVPILGEKPGEALVDIHYQGCSDDGFCYPPQTKKIKLTIDNNLALSEASLETLEASPLPPVVNEVDAVEAVFTKHWTIVILTFFGFGLLLAFTPCVLPMVPVLSGLIVGHGKDLTSKKAFLLSLSYVLSMSVTYALVGAIVAKLGHNLQVLMQTPWVIMLFSACFVLLALSMFGLYELRLPVSWQAKLARLSRSQGSGHYISAAVMGCLSTLILSPCVTAPLIGALGYIAHSGDMGVGAIALFFLGLGMGAPLLLIGASAGKWLPKTGQWMNMVKAFFGVLLLGVAIYLLERILPGPLVMWLWAILLVFSGVYCGAFQLEGKFRQSLGLILLVYGFLILIGASMGTTNPLQPLTGPLAKQATSVHHETIKTLTHLKNVLENAKGKPVMLDFYADWCSSCKIMEGSLFKDPRVETALKKFVVIKVDVSANKEQAKALLEQFNVVAPPTFLFLNREGFEQAQLRLVGETSTQQFLAQLKHARTLDKSS